MIAAERLLMTSPLRSLPPTTGGTALLQHNIERDRFIAAWLPGAESLATMPNSELGNLAGAAKCAGGLVGGRR
jgi:hypothetical protein